MSSAHTDSSAPSEPALSAPGSSDASIGAADRTPYPVPPAGGWTRGAPSEPAQADANTPAAPTPALSDAALARIATDWHRLESLEGAEVLKSNPSRDVIRLPAAGEGPAARPAVVIKRYRVRGRSEHLKYRVLPSRAAREFRALTAMRDVGLPVPTPFAFFESRAGRTLHGAGLVMEFLDDVFPLPDLVFADPSGEPSRDTLLRRAGAIVAAVHALGISHPDLHLGNFLGNPDDAEDVRLLDLHAVRHLAVVRAPRRRLDLAKLVHSLGEDIDEHSVRQVIEAYLDACGETTLGSVAEEVGRVRVEARQVERVRLRSRDKRCWKNTSQFRREERGAWRIHRRRTFPDAALDALVDGEWTARRTFVERPGHAVAEVELPTPEGPRPYIVKVRERSGLRGVIDRFHRGPLERGWAAARQLEVRGIPHAEAAALLVERRGPAIIRTILVTESLPGRTLVDAVRERRGDPRELERFLARAADTIAPIVRTLHRSRIHHRDVNPSNWLVLDHDEEGNPLPAGEIGRRVALLDLDSIHPGRDATLRRRRHNLVQLALLPDGVATRRLRARFLLRYHVGEPIHRAWLRALDAELAERQVEEIEKRVARERAEAAARPTAAPEGAGDPSSPAAGTKPAR